MKIGKLEVGYLRCNCYILSINNKVLIIDPGDNPEKIDNLVNNREIVGIIITHHHHDHDGAVDYFKNKYAINVYDKFNLIEGINTIDKFKFEVIYTPGHREDAISIYFYDQRIMFVGDFIFKDSVGRCDLAGGNVSDMMKSIAKIKNYNRDVTIYPGHGEITTLGYEIDNNPYFKEFI